MAERATSDSDDPPRRIGPIAKVVYVLAVTIGALTVPSWLRPWAVPSLLSVQVVLLLALRVTRSGGRPRHEAAVGRVPRPDRLSDVPSRPGRRSRPSTSPGIVPILSSDQPDRSGRVPTHVRSDHDRDPGLDGRSPQRSRDRFRGRASTHWAAPASLPARSTTRWLFWVGTHEGTKTRRGGEGRGTGKRRGRGNAGKMAEGRGGIGGLWMKARGLVRGDLGWFAVPILSAIDRASQRETRWCSRAS